MKKFELITPERNSPGAAGSSAKTIASKSPRKTKKNSGPWEQNFRLPLDLNLALAVPQWLARVHADFAAFGGLPVVDGDSLWFNAWSAANLLEWTDTVAFGELEPLRLRRLAVKAMEAHLARMRSPGRKTELERKICELRKAYVGRFAREQYETREETARRQLEEGIEFI